MIELIDVKIYEYRIVIGLSSRKYTNRRAVPSFNGARAVEKYRGLRDYLILLVSIIFCSVTSSTGF